MHPTAGPLPTPPSWTSRAMTLTHRWMSVMAGVLLLTVTLSGALLPHQGEIMRSLSPAAYSRSAGPERLSLPQAIATIESHHPDETAASATWINDVIEVRTRQSAYTVDPSTGDEIGRVAAPPSWLATLDNLHRCLLSCQGPGHVRWMSQEVPRTRWLAEQGLTVGDVVVGTVGIVLLALTVSALRVWWPLQRYRRTVLSARWRTTRLSRDTDLLKAAGLVLLPLLFLWGYYATALDPHPTRQASTASTAGAETPAAQAGTSQEQDRVQDIGPHRAVAATQETRPGKPVALFLPEPGNPTSTYTVWLSQNASSPYSRALGSVAVSVDPGTGRTTVPPTPYRDPRARAD